MSLLEVLLAAAILGAFLIAFSVMAGNNMLWNKKNEERHYAAILAHICMEMSKGQDFDELNVELNLDEYTEPKKLFDGEDADAVKAQLQFCKDELDHSETVNIHGYTYELGIKREEEDSEGDYILYAITTECKLLDSGDEPPKLESKYIHETGSD